MKIKPKSQKRMSEEFRAKSEEVRGMSEEFRAKSEEVRGKRNEVRGLLALPSSLLDLRSKLNRHGTEAVYNLSLLTRLG